MALSQALSGRGATRQALDLQEASTKVVLLILPLGFLSIFLGLPMWLGRLVGQVLYLAAILSAAYLARRLLDRRPLQDLGLRRYAG